MYNYVAFLLVESQADDGASPAQCACHDTRVVPMMSTWDRVVNTVCQTARKHRKRRGFKSQMQF